jgi:DNA-binding GntR family transcriptional regulator
MFEFLPRLDTKGKTSAQKVDEIEEYLYRLRTELELILGNIAPENLSPSLLSRIENLEKAVKEDGARRDEEISQLANK